MFGFFFLIFIIVIGVSIYTHQRKKAFKRDVVYPVLKEIFGEVEYGHTQGFQRDRIYQTKLVSSGNTYRSEDYLKATYEGVSFEFSDVLIQDVTKTKDSTVTTTYFRGQWIIVKPKRKIDGRLYVIDRNFAHSNPKGFLFGKDHSLEKIELESIAFNKEFRIYTESGHEAFYMLNPTKLLKLLEISDKNVSFYFDNDELHIAIYSNKDMFEPKFFGEMKKENYQGEIKSSILKVLEYAKVFEVEREL